MKKILITGFTGLLGCNLSYLLCDKYELAGVARTNMRFKNIKSRSLDVTNYLQLIEFFEEFKPDIVIHTVALTNVDLCETNIKEAELVNVNSTKYISDLCRKYNSKIIYISSDAVYDGKDNKLYMESDPVAPVNVYGKTKLDAEYYTLLCPNALVIRTNFYGFNIQNKYSLGEWILFSLLESKEIRLVNDITFSPILVNELVDIIEKCIKHDLHGIYNICGTDGITKYKFGKYLQEIFQVGCGSIIETSSEDIGFVAKRTKNMGMSNSKVKNDLKISISTPMESIEKFHQFYQKGYKEKLLSFRNKVE